MKTARDIATIPTRASKTEFFLRTPAPRLAVGESPPASVTATFTGGSVATIYVKMDVGFGNSIFLRGNGGGLSWDHGVALQCVDGKTWRWSGALKGPIAFKPLLNDCLWSEGNDLTVQPGQTLEVKPNFA